ncbi:TetR/AcrR family transcriptional regulator [Streptomyces avicenniae]|uniref:TetR/AcrR family transcriptional regulator n=1 Tax=Streptomyces avicenniae TaxID=500153 RepID=UPI00069AB44E|nr:TetR/AcrR family transcriptional regulator [Streptomyces avicenniae]
MPRVSAAHLEARRRQILEGAARCFARDGFHATSMQDVLKETGLSAGAVYRYFPGKEAMIVDLAHSVLRAVGEVFEDASLAERPPLPDAILANALTRATELLAFPPSLVVQVWAETVRSPELAEVMREGLTGLVGHWQVIVETYQRNGWMRADVPAQHVARTLAACAQGYLLQSALVGPLDTDVVVEGLRGIMSMNAPAAPTG